MSKPLTKASREDAKKLTALIAEAKEARATSKTAQLDKYSEVLIKAREEGAKMREITEGVVKLGIGVSEETVRLWFQKNKVASPLSTPRTKLSKPTVGILPSPKDSAPVPPPAPTRGPRIAREDI
jgi:hypothetical protein